MGADQKGVLTIAPPLPPGCMSTVWGDDARFVKTYFSTVPGKLVYSTFDWATRDADGYYFVLGRTDDVINVAGHRLGTREIEEAVQAHPGIAEVAVVGVADALKGQMPVAFAVVKDPARVASAERCREHAQGSHGHGRSRARRDRPAGAVHFVSVLPKTRSGKLLRRSIQALAEGRDPGDLTTIEDPAALESIRAALGRAQLMAARPAHVAAGARYARRCHRQRALRLGRGRRSRRAADLRGGRSRAISRRRAARSSRCRRCRSSPAAASSASASRCRRWRCCAPATRASRATSRRWPTCSRAPAARPTSCSAVCIRLCTIRRTMSCRRRASSSRRCTTTARASTPACWRTAGSAAAPIDIVPRLRPSAAAGDPAGRRAPERRRRVRPGRRHRRLLGAQLRRAAGSRLRIAFARLAAERRRRALRRGAVAARRGDDGAPGNGLRRAAQRPGADAGRPAATGSPRSAPRVCRRSACAARAGASPSRSSTATRAACIRRRVAVLDQLGLLDAGAARGARSVASAGNPQLPRPRHRARRAGGALEAC